jgi:uncharacterized protein (UPF0276 family)
MLKTFGSLNAWPVAVGLAEGPHAAGFIRRQPDVVDYVEVPYEKLRHDHALLEMQEQFPLILHCASLSIGGFVTPDQTTIDDVAHHANLLRTPWIGEHLAFILADPMEPMPGGDPPPDDPISLTYTVCPQLSEETLEKVIENFRGLQARFEQPLILENPPQYFEPPGSTMSLVEFIVRMCERWDINLLLDLTHFLVTAINMKLDPFRELERYPLDRLVEIHLSGLNTQSRIAWDDHSRPAPEPVFELLAAAVERARPAAVTFEYNWTADFSDSLLVEHLARAREAVSRA